MLRMSVAGNAGAGVRMPGVREFRHALATFAGSGRGGAAGQAIGGISAE
jgi:hypothetical protein